VIFDWFKRRRARKLAEASALQGYKVQGPLDAETKAALDIILEEANRGCTTTQT
jgi:hypothetical protein